MRLYGAGPLKGPRPEIGRKEKPSSGEKKQRGLRGGPLTENCGPPGYGSTKFVIGGKGIIGCHHKKAKSLMKKKKTEKGGHPKGREKM